VDRAADAQREREAVAARDLGDDGGAPVEPEERHGHEPVRAATARGDRARRGGPRVRVSRARGDG